MSTKFSCEEDEQLLKLIKQQPALYNTKLKSYKDVTMKNNIWAQIAKRMRKKEIDCRTRWKNVRDYYKKKRNEVIKEMGNGTLTMDSNFFQRNKHLSFLEDLSTTEETATRKKYEKNTSVRAKKTYTRHKEKSTEPTSDPEKVEENVIDDQIKIECEFPSLNDILSMPKEYEEPERTKSKSNEHNLIELLKKSSEERTTIIKELLRTCEPKSDASIYMFFQSIATTVSKFSPQLQARAKAEIMNTVAQLEIQSISQQYMQTSPSADLSFTSCDDLDEI